jgi:hypothetical protein
MGTPLSLVNVLSGTETTQALQLGAGTTVNGQPIAGSGSNVVNTTATLLTWTAAANANKVLVVDSTSPIAITLPAATGTGNSYEIYIDTAATATGHTILAAGSDKMAGLSWVSTTASNNADAFKTATATAITLNGTTQGGVPGDRISLRDMKASVWSVQMWVAATGTYATPFS